MVICLIREEEEEEGKTEVDRKDGWYLGAIQQAW